MRIGKQDQSYTAIATSDAESITVRGQDLCDELIGKIDFTDYFWLLVLGERPDEKQRRMMDACLVAIAEQAPLRLLVRSLSHNPPALRPMLVDALAVRTTVLTLTVNNWTYGATRWR